MKIIGESDDNFILTASKDETVHLVGRRYNYPDSLKVGDEIKVSEMYERIEQINGHQDDLKEYANELKGIAVLLEVIDPLIKKELGIKEEKK